MTPLNALPILRAQVLNPYRSKRPIGFYHIVKGHSGVDLKYIYQDLPSPVTGVIVDILKQNEMGNVIYLQDSIGTIHAFAHMDSIIVKLGEKVARNQILGKTGNTGAKSTSPHSHYELITTKPVNFIDNIMTRTLGKFKGYNTDPILYLKALYFKYHVDLDGNAITNI